MLSHYQTGRFFLYQMGIWNITSYGVAPVGGCSDFYSFIDKSDG
jgi:hypothetical protein